MRYALPRYPRNYWTNVDSSKYEIGLIQDGLMWLVVAGISILVVVFWSLGRVIRTYARNKYKEERGHTVRGNSPKST